MRPTQIIFSLAVFVLAQSAVAQGQGQGNGPPPPPGDVNVINAPDVNVANVPDVFIANDASASVPVTVQNPQEQAVLLFDNIFSGGGGGASGGLVSGSGPLPPRGRIHSAYINLDSTDGEYCRADIKIEITRAGETRTVNLLTAVTRNGPISQSLVFNRPIEFEYDPNLGETGLQLFETRTVTGVTSCPTSNGLLIEEIQ